MFKNNGVYKKFGDLPKSAKLDAPPVDGIFFHHVTRERKSIDAKLVRYPAFAD